MSYWKLETNTGYSQPVHQAIGESSRSKESITLKELEEMEMMATGVN